MKKRRKEKEIRKNRGGDDVWQWSGVWLEVEEEMEKKKMGGEKRKKKRKKKPLNQNEKRNDGIMENRGMVVGMRGYGRREKIESEWSRREKKKKKEKEKLN